jgi:two-component system CheB/CheR fusion protein
LARNNGPLTVGIGASAGGVEALQSFFRAMPPDSGLAFVVVMHLGERHESVLSEILQRCTAMPVVVARNGDPIDPGHVYVLGVDAVLTVSRRKLRLRRRSDVSRERHTIDVFLSSLAEDAEENAIAVILSGLGHDGTLGAKAIKEKGGLTIAQKSDHKAPSHPEMPESAIAAGAIDLELPVEAMGAKLLEYAEGLGRLETEGQPRARRDRIERSRRAICQILVDQLGHDFAGYKERTMLRRIERRMQVLQLPDIDEYVARLRQDRVEVLALFRDLLIGVTAFLRDREAFDALIEKVVPHLFEGKRAGEGVRVWVPGCATGEEVYSIAILLLEHVAKRKQRVEVQCFATDIDEAAIAVARAAHYPAALVRNVPDELIARYFTADPTGTYTLAREVREICIFSTHSVIRDPPYSRIDLISCRNLMIYLDADLQARLIPMFHYALRPGGYLLLGTSENLSQHGEYFAPLDQKQRIFQRRDDVPKAGTFSLALPGVRRPRPLQPSFAHRGDGQALRQSVERRVLERFAPAHVIVNSDGDVIHYSARTGSYLEHGPGAPTRQLVAIARRGLRPDLRAALSEAIETGRPVVRKRVRVETDDGDEVIDLTVEPLPDRNGHTLFLVVFNDVRAPRETEPHAPGAAVQTRGDVEHLEHELRDTRERLQSTIEEYETALEELKSANEELLSTNEELQSTNEELETSREETQSINEELNTVNSELQSKLEQLDQANDDLRNLFESTPVGTVFLDRNLVIRTFTPAIGTVFNLIASDRGRPLTDIASGLEGVDLPAEIEAVQRSREGRERRVARRDGKAHYLMRILPDNTAQDGGVLISFVDVTRIVEVEKHQREWTEGAGALLTMVLRIAGESVPPRPTSSTPEAEALMNRLRNLAGTYNLLTRVEWAEISMRDLVGEEIGHLASGTGSRVAIDGPEVMLKPKAAIALGMALHEMAANAVRHGALSAPDGSIRVGWAIEQPGTPQARLVLEWRESGGPQASGQDREGFGRRLIEEELPIDLDAAGRIDFAEDGVLASVAVPLSTGLVSLPRGSTQTTS